MKAEEEQCFQSKKTDASLYNGRPTGTGTQCHSVGALSNTLSIPKDKDGVSVEHAHTPTKQWFVLRVSYGRVLKAKAVVDACHIDVMPRCVKSRLRSMARSISSPSLLSHPSFLSTRYRKKSMQCSTKIFSGCLVATAYIPKEAMKIKKIIDYEKK